MELTKIQFNLSHPQPSSPVNHPIQISKFKIKRFINQASSRENKKSQAKSRSLTGGGNVAHTEHNRPVNFKSKFKLREFFRFPASIASLIICTAISSSSFSHNPDPSFEKYIDEFVSFLCYQGDFDGGKHLAMKPCDRFCFYSSEIGVDYLNDLYSNLPRRELKVNKYPRGEGLIMSNENQRLEILNILTLLRKYALSLTPKYVD
ncbi:hypothetical protein CONCODRAFT_7337 [Conidiobolus coronatus NRRL 28638]|uniref:Uncharacterized protein n=1 Tax=Conidiobolus coronatus (strain ATCC 28846 / CBS 209.66 / NRRL 28638) TaxID=796925 RepID=A0A137P5A3_CONC2|nr:hypothetical protein CONCODRAFT_7337 [Conidiobolus coronatus NRRL 28638]|eukprot:KXN70101.1 hypothetical protein CONCODRAFT_7337 [Conidiobolus coronatus NRRL 28638]